MKYFYYVLDKRGKFILDEGRLPIFYTKKVANSLSANFANSTVEKMLISDLYNLINNVQ